MKLKLALLTAVASLAAPAVMTASAQSTGLYASGGYANYNFDSPGGEAGGVMEAARGLRAAAAAAGKPLWAYVDGCACSAAYALACAADRIVVGHTSRVGSIGIINTRVDLTAGDAASGVRYAVVASGARKSDGHPHVAVSDAEIKAMQVHVDALADVFFRLVAELRGLTPEAVKSTEAGVFHGAAAQAEGLVDETNSFDSMLAALASKGASPMPATLLDTRAALDELAKGEGDDALAAQRAIAAIDGGKEKDKDEETEDDEADDDKADDKAEKVAASSSSGRVSASLAGELAASVNAQGKMLAQLMADREGEQRATLLATRPDLEPGLAKLLASKPVAEVRDLLEAMPKPALPKLAAAAAVTGTRGEQQGAPAPSAQAHELDLRMGLVTPRMGVERVGNVMRFGVLLTPAPSEAAKDGGSK